MIKPIMRDIFFLNQKSELATEADKQVAITNAEAEAQKTSIAADAQAEANRKLAESL